MDDQRDYEEEEYNRAMMEKEGREELECERLENLGLIPGEHNHGYVIRDGEQYILECLDCHDEDNCDTTYCLWCE